MFRFKALQDDEFRLCWALDNLRPLPPSQNFGEGNRRHLFDGCATWSELTAKVRSWDLGSEQERLEAVFAGLSDCAIVSDMLPQLPVGLGVLDSMFPHRFRARTSGKLSLVDACADDRFLLKVVAYIVGSGRPMSRHLFYRNAAFLNKVPSHFYPSAAAALVRTYAPGGSVVDPFLGWGGRTLGALCMGAASVCGTDLQAESVEGCRRLVQECSAVRIVDSEFVNADFASYLSSTSRRFDLLMTSPPFMATEDYGVEGHSDVRAWSERVVQPLVRGALRVLKPSGHVAFHGQDRRNMPVLTALLTTFSAAGFQNVAEYRYGKTVGQSVVVMCRT